MSDYRSACFSNYNKKCAVCSSQAAIEVHHIDGNAGNSDPRNLIPLCNDCHTDVESECWTDDVAADIDLTHPLKIWLVEKKRAYSPNSDGSDRPASVGGLSEQDMNKIRELRGHIQTEVVEQSVSNRDAVLWAVENELDRRRDTE